MDHGTAPIPAHSALSRMHGSHGPAAQGLETLKALLASAKDGAAFGSIWHSSQDVVVGLRKAVEDGILVLLPTRGRAPGEVNRNEILRVLERAAGDNHFIAELTDHGSSALWEYDLSWEEKAALISGDIRWIEEHVGELNERQRTWLNCRLQQEVW